MNKDKTTGTLNAVLKEAKPEDIQKYLAENEAYLAEDDRPFASFFREMLKAKKLRQQEVFLRADISERYGYKLISEEKHTVRRDVILRLCLGAHLNIRETNRALQLYGMTPLYPRISRDAVLIIAVNTERFEIEEVDELLREHGMEPLYAVRSAEE